MSYPVFPNGFESWQKTHFEVVEALCYLRDIEEAQQLKGFSEMLNRSATEELYQLAKDLTDKFEKENIDRKNSNLFDLIEAFVSRETNA